MPDAARRWSHAAVVVLTAITILTEAALLLAAWAPAGILEQAGGWIRRPDDVTPERVVRFHVAAAALSLAIGILALLLLRRAGAVQRFFDDAKAEVGSFPKEVRRWWNSISVSNRVAYLLILSCGVALRLHYLNAPMAYDEAYSYTNFARRPLVEALSDYNNTNNHLLNTLCMHLMDRLFGQRDWALRLPVFFAGVLLVAATFPWARARIGAGPALVTTALVAASPMLVDYSVNARGYMYLTLFAVLLDGCLLRIALTTEASPRAATWIAAGLCIWLGFFAILTFVHPLAGIVVWFLVASDSNARTSQPSALPSASLRVAANPDDSSLPTRNSQRATRNSFLNCLFISAIAVAATYAPAFVFRGFQAWENEFVKPLSFAVWMAEFPSAVWKGIERWIAGGAPAPLLMVLAWGGVVAWIRRCIADRQSIGWGALPIASLLLVPLGVLAFQRVAPPPRLFLFQAPWFHLLVAVGAGYAVGLIHKLGVRFSGDGGMRLVAYATMGAGVWFAFENPILREPHQREFGVGSVPAAIEHLSTMLKKGERARLFAPLPCDHPAIYYASKYRTSLKINGRPRRGERLFLIVRRRDPWEKTLGDVVVKQQDLYRSVAPWNHFANFRELALWAASRTIGQSGRMPRTPAPVEKTP